MFKLLIFEAIAMSSKKPVIYSTLVEYVYMYIISITVNYITAAATLWLNYGLQTTR